jgi:anti-sigma B factor antagonist
MLLQIEHREVRPGTIVVSLIGRFMLGRESQQLETLIPQWIGQGYRNFIFDLGGVTHIDSTGIGRCIYTYNKVAQAGGKLLMAAAPTQVRDGFRVTRLDTVFKFYPDVDAALQALAPAAQA